MTKIEDLRHNKICLVTKIGNYLEGGLSFGDI